MTKTKESTHQIDESESELEERIRELEERLKDKNREIKKWKNKYKEMKKKFDDLRNSLPVMGASTKTAEVSGVPSSKTYFKQNRSEGHKRPTGGQKGHKGHARKRPTPNVPPIFVDLDQCPDCHRTLKRPMDKTSRSRVITDIPPPQPVYQEFIFPGYWCPHCKKVVYGSVPWLPPNVQFGFLIACWISFQMILGLSIKKIRASLLQTYRIRISDGTILKLERWVAECLKDDYERLKQEVKKAKVVQADETSFRINGNNGWLWVFCNFLISFYEIADTRGSRVPREIMKGFDGVLETDAWRAYDSVDCSKHQMDLIHINRWLEKLEHKYRIQPRSILSSQPVKITSRGRPRKEVVEFVNSVRQLLQRAIKFSEKQPSPSIASRHEEYQILNAQMKSIISTKWTDPEIIRVCKELRRQADSIFTFIEVKEVPWNNNGAERGVRAGVLYRKISGGRRTWAGADILKIILSIYETGKKQGQNFMDFVLHRLKNRGKNLSTGGVTLET